MNKSRNEANLSFGKFQNGLAVRFSGGYIPRNVIQKSDHIKSHIYRDSFMSDFYIRKRHTHRKIWKHSGIKNIEK